MNILYCGDKNIEDGLLISVLSLLNTVEEELHIYVFTMHLEYEGKECLPVRDEFIAWLNGLVKEKSSRDQKNTKEKPEEWAGTKKKEKRSFVKKIDLSDLFAKNLPIPNMQTRFTPCCMLRLFADEIPEMPSRILYLDTDIVCRRDIGEFYHQDMEGFELAGVLDYYGRWFFHQKRWKFWKWDYLNSGVLLLNMEEIRKNGLFAKCRELCASKEMFMPDQSALNKLATAKKICPRRYNDQRKLHEDTVIQHFTTSFRFFPWIRTVSVKPWEAERVHEVLKLHEYDELLEEYKQLKAARRIKGSC